MPESLNFHHGAHREHRELIIDKEKLNELTETIIGAAIRVHRELGPGLLESAYEACLLYELVEAGLSIERQVALPVRYRGVNLDCGYRIDLLVEKAVIVELKAVNRFEPIHEAQLLSYLKLLGCNVGLLMNFNVKILKNGIRRMIHGIDLIAPAKVPAENL